MQTDPVASVVTPFRDTREFLAECIESVLAQTCSSFEYILSDNCSTDGSTEIAESYARRDPRIRLIRQPKLLPQVQHYNAALREISPSSKYCKIVQADDFLFPECLKLMVQAFEQSENIGLVSAYDLKGNVVRGSRFPYGTSPVSGKETARLYLRTGIFPFGSPTTVMYRSSLVRGQQPFFDELLLHEDTEKCMQILEKWGFAFVHQVLSFLRVGNESISSAVRTLEPVELDRYILVQRYASRFLGADEAAALKEAARKQYYSLLADQALRLRGRDFWCYHRDGLKTLGETLNSTYLALRIASRIFQIIANPGSSVSNILRSWRRRMA